MLDPSIPLAVKPPQIDNPLEAIAKGYQLRNMGQENQLRSLQIQQEQQAMQDDQTMRQIMAQHSGDLETALPAMAGKVSPKSFMGLQNSWLEMQKNKFGVLEGQQKVADALHETMGKLALGVQAAGNTPAAFSGAVDSMVKLNPQLGPHLAPYVQQAQQNPNSIAAMMESMIAGTGVGQKEREVSAAEQTAAARETTAGTGAAEAAAKMPGLQAQSDQQVRQNTAAQLAAAGSPGDYQAKRNSLPHGLAMLFPERFDPVAIQRVGMSPEQQAALPGVLARNATAQQEATGTKPVQPAEQANLDLRTKEVGLAGGRLAVEQANARRQQQQFDATYGALLGPNGEKLDPEAAKAMAEQDPFARAVANYQVAPPQMGTRGLGAGILRKVMAINPQYNAQNWQAQAAMTKGYTSGSQSKEISGINTALGHIGVLGSAIDALGNGDVQGLNKMAQWLQVQTGNDAATTFKAIVHKVAPELNRAYLGGVGAQGEVLAQESDFDPKLSPQQLRSNVAVTAKLLRSKIGSLENQWRQTVGSDFAGRFLTPEAQGAVNRWAPEPAAQPQQPRPRPSASAAKPQFQVGQSVMYNGAPHKIKAINPDGKLVLEQ